MAKEKITVYRFPLHHEVVVEKMVRCVWRELAFHRIEGPDGIREEKAADVALAESFNRGIGPVFFEDMVS